MPDRVLRFIIAGDSRGSVRALRETETAARSTKRELDSTGTTAEVTGGKMDALGGAASGLRSTVGKVAGVAGLAGLAFGLRDVVTAGEDWQKQQAQLQLALKNTGSYSVAAMKGLNEAVDKTSTHGGFDPSTEVGGLAQLIRMTGDASQAVKLNTEAVDLARGGQMSYGQALKAVSQVQTGFAGRLQKYIGIVTPVTTAVNALTAAQKKAHPEWLAAAKLQDKHATAAAANAQIMAKFGGAANAYSHTAAGAMSNLSNSVHILMERLGKMLLPTIASVAHWLANMAGVVLKHWPQITSTASSVFGKVKSIVKDLAPYVLTLAGAFVVYKGAVMAAVLWSRAMAAVELASAFIAAAEAIGPLAAGMVALDVAMDANPIGAVVTALALLTAGIIYAYNHCKTFRDIVDRTFRGIKIIVTATVGFIKDHWKTLIMILGGPFLAAGIFIATHFKQVKHWVGDAVNWIADKFSWLGDKILAPFKAIGGFIAHPMRSLGIHLPFGLNTGGLVPGFAGGGIVGGYGNRDTVPARLTPGEFVLRKQAVQAIGTRNLNALNNGHATVGGDDVQVVDLHHTTMLNDRVLAESVTRYQLKRAARR